MCQYIIDLMISQINGCKMIDATSNALCSLCISHPLEPSGKNPLENGHRAHQTAQIPASRLPTEALAGVKSVSSMDTRPTTSFHSWFHEAIHRAGMPSSLKETSLVSLPRCLPCYFFQNWLLIFILIHLLNAFVALVPCIDRKLAISRCMNSTTCMECKYTTKEQSTALFWYWNLEIAHLL